MKVAGEALARLQSIVFPLAPGVVRKCAGPRVRRCACDARGVCGSCIGCIAGRVPESRVDGENASLAMVLFKLLHLFPRDGHV